MTKNKQPNRWAAVITDPEDAARILQRNVKKSATYQFSFMGDSIVSTTDNALWAEQRQALNPAFLPNKVLAESVFPITVRRARESAMGLKPDQIFNAHDYFMWEALTQLQLGLLGETLEQSDASTGMLLDAYKEAIYAGKNMHNRRKASAQVIHQWAEGFMVRKPPGPASAALLENCPMNLKARRDSISVIGFAGHDTTGNLLTWVCVFYFGKKRVPNSRRCNFH